MGSGKRNNNSSFVLDILVWGLQQSCAGVSGSGAINPPLIAPEPLGHHSGLLAPSNYQHTYAAYLHCLTKTPCIFSIQYVMAGLARRITTHSEMRVEMIWVRDSTTVSIAAALSLNVEIWWYLNHISRCVSYVWRRHLGKLNWTSMRQGFVFQFILKISDEVPSM